MKRAKGITKSASTQLGPTVEDELVSAALLGHRDDFVIDLRIEGQTESYLRGHEVKPISGKRSLRVVRRTLDIVTAMAALLVAAPIFILIALVSQVTSDSPVIFTQERVGRGGKIFRCHKFRSMHPDAEERLAELIREDAEFREQWIRDQKVSSDPRVTFTGRFLRKTSLDELPQLINVLKGEMSIVGPRPILPSETVRYGDAMPIVLSVRPGITGLWQGSGRNDLTYDERVGLDVKYVVSQSLLSDGRILMRTVTSLATGRGAS